ncbi:5837_t:CDS:2, partial [Gigaspora margarita]
MAAPTGKILPLAMDNTNDEFYHYQQQNPPTTIAIQMGVINNTTHLEWLHKQHNSLPAKNYQIIVNANHSNNTYMEKRKTFLDFAIGVAVVGSELSPLVLSLLVKICRCVGIVYGEIRHCVAVAGSEALQVAELVIGA